MKVVLVRHGQPDFDAQQWIGIRDVHLSLRQYRYARVTTGPAHNLWFSDSVASQHVMASGLVRAQDSALLCHDIQPEISELFNESELPYPKRLLFPLPWSFLVAVCRIAWLFGYRTNAPGLRRDTARAAVAAAFLTNRASEHGTVIVFGHEIMNRLIARELRKKGWKLRVKKGSGYWSKTVMSRESQSCANE